MHYNLANLLAGLAIISILALSLISLAAGTQGAVAVEQAAQQLAQELSCVRQRAVAENQTYSVYFEWGSKSFAIRAADMSGVMRRVMLPPGVEWYGPFTEKILFKGTGKVDQGGTITFVHPQSGEKVGVVIAPFTGRIQISRGEKK